MKIRGDVLVERSSPFALENEERVWQENKVKISLLDVRFVAKHRHKYVN